MNKKLLLILSLVFVLCIVLSACGGANDTDTDTSTQSQTINPSDDKDESNTDSESEIESDSNLSSDTDSDINSDTSSAKIDYTVSVVDFKGDPVSSGLFVQIYQDGEEIGSMKKASKDGTAVFSLDEGEYTFELIYTDDTLIYDEAECTLTANDTSKEIMLYNAPIDDSITIYPCDSKTGDRYEYQAERITEGANKVGIDTMSYYVFTPTRGGVYKFGYICDVAITIGYYGGSSYVLPESTIEVKDGFFEIEIMDTSISTESGGTASYVIGVRSLAVDNCYLTIERIGEATKEIQRLEYVAQQVPKSTCKYNYLNCDIVDLDITDSSLAVVYNEEDGYYHLGAEDGSIVLVRISTASKYIASFKEMCDVTKLFKIFTDEEGTPLREELYNDMFTKYAEKCDDSGVVALTKELEYAIKNILEQQDWHGKNNIFKEPETVDDAGNIVEGARIEVPEGNAWLFACCTLVENDKGAVDSKIVVTDTLDPKPNLVKLDALQTLYFKASQNRTAVLTIENAQGIKVTVYGEEYTANEDGTIEITIAPKTETQTDQETGEETQITLPIEFEITSMEEQKQDVEFNYVTFLG